MLFWFTYRKTISELLGVLRLLLLLSALSWTFVVFQCCGEQFLLLCFVLNFYLLINITMIYILFQNLVRNISVLTLSFHWWHFKPLFISVQLSGLERIFIGLLMRCLSKAGYILNIYNILFLDDLLRPWSIYGNRVLNCIFLSGKKGSVII